jgi:hypothetical protein
MNQIEVLQMVLIAQNPQEVGTEPKCLAQKNGRLKCAEYIGVPFLDRVVW